MCVDINEVFSRFDKVNGKLQIINDAVNKNKGAITIVVNGTEIKGTVNEIKSVAKFEMGEISATISLYDNDFKLSMYNVLDVEKAF